MVKEIPFTGPSSETLEVPRTARYATLGGGGREVREIWYVLHGYGQLARDFLRPFRKLASEHTLVVAPEGFSRFYLAPTDRAHGKEDRVGASWMTREDREVEIRDYVRFLDLLRARVEEGVEEEGGVKRTVLGFSQGCHTAARWVALGRVRPDRLVVWGAALPRDPEMEVMGPALARTDLVLVRGEEDPHRSLEAEADEEDRLREAEVPYRLRSHPGDHRIHRRTLEALAGK